MGYAHIIDFNKVTQHEIDNTNHGLFLYKTIMDGRDNVPDIIQSAEDTGDIHALGLFHAIL